jgi:archaellum component FlaC
MFPGTSRQTRHIASRHAKHDDDIAAMEAEHEKARAEHRIAEQNVKNTEEHLKRYDEQLKRVKDSHAENKNAEMAKNEAEKMKMDRDKALETAHSNMKAEFNQLKQLTAGATSHQTRNYSKGYSG